MPQITVQVPDGLFVIHDIMPRADKVYPLLVVGPSTHYIDLMCTVDGAPPKKLARWCNPYQPQTYVVYQPEVLGAQHVVFSFIVYPGDSVYPKA